MKKILLLISCFIAVELTNAQEKFEWAKQMGGEDLEAGNAIAIDASGNLYTTGYFQGTSDFDPGAGTFELTSKGDNDIFILKLSASGSFLWAKQIGGSYSDIGTSITVDALGNVYTAGQFEDTVDFDPGIGSFNLSAIDSIDMFISKLDSSGNFVWAKSIGGFSDDYGTSIALDIIGNVYTTGYFKGTVDFNPGAGSMNLKTSGNFDIFISKLDSSGNFVWAKQMGGISDEGAFSIHLDKSGNIYTTGPFSGKVDFNPGSGTSYLTSDGAFDVFIAKLDSSGNFAWAKKMGGYDYTIGYSISLDANDNVYTTGYFMGTADFNPGIGTFYLTAVGSADIFISKLNSSGNFVWAKRIGDVGYESSTAITLDASGNAYITGSFSGTVDFDPGLSTFYMSAVGYDNIFILKLDKSGNFMWAKGMNGDSYGSGNAIATDTFNTVYTTGYFFGTVDFDPGQDDFELTDYGSSDIFIHKMSECKSTTSNFYVKTCGSYIWNGQYYDSSGTYRQSLTNSTGCDSIITLYLTIKKSSYSTITASVCKSYTLNNKTYSSSGMYSQQFTNYLGCDSVLILYLDIIPVDTYVTLSGSTLTAYASGVGYQWVSCPSYSIIPGATSQSYWAKVKGDYAVIVTENGCTDTSGCYTVSDLGINDYFLSGKIRVSPNPTNGIIHISFSNPDEHYVIEIVNSLGMPIFSRKFIGETYAIDLSEYANGLYIVKVMDGEQLIGVQKIIKQ